MIYSDLHFGITIKTPSRHTIFAVTWQT